MATPRGFPLLCHSQLESFRACKVPSLTQRKTPPKRGQSNSDVIHRKKKPRCGPGLVSVNGATWSLGATTLHRA